MKLSFRKCHLLVNQSIYIFLQTSATCKSECVRFLPLCMYFPLFRFGTIIVAAVLLFPLGSFFLCRRRRRCCGLPAPFARSLSLPTWQFHNVPPKARRESNSLAPLALAHGQPLRRSPSRSNFVCRAAIGERAQNERVDREQRGSGAEQQRQLERGSLSFRHICVVSFAFVLSELLFGFRALCGRSRKQQRVRFADYITYSYSYIYYGYTYGQTELE